MGYVIAHIQLRHGAASRAQFIEGMTKAVPEFERLGWKLKSAFIGQIGMLNEVWDIWEVRDANAVQELMEGMQARPDFLDWSKGLSEVIISEELHYVRTLPFSPQD